MSQIKIRKMRKMRKRKKNEEKEDRKSHVKPRVRYQAKKGIEEKKGREK